MKEIAIGKLKLCSVSLLLMGLLGTGCSQTAPSQTAPSPEVAGTFTGQDLPSEVEELEGTPLYSISGELSGMHQFDGAAYLLIAPQDPTKALLVSESGVAPAELSKRESKPTKISGVKELIDSEKLKNHVTERYQMALQTNADGKVILLKAKTTGTPMSPGEGEASSEQ